MTSQLELLIGSGLQNRIEDNHTSGQGNTGSGTGSEPGGDDRFRNRSIFRNRFSSEPASSYDRFRNSTPTGEEHPEPVPPQQAPLAGEREFVEHSSLPLLDEGSRGQELHEAAGISDSASGTGRNRVTQQPTLRPYQADAIAAVERELAAHRTTLLVLPTGTGKTVVFAELARRTITTGAVLVLAHRSELLEQASNKLRDVGVRSAIEQADRRADPRVVPVVVASVQTLQRQRLERYAPDAFSLIVIDEAHHAAAKSYGNILARFSTARVLGVTATPDRGDGKALGEIFNSVAFTYEMRAAIRDGYLSPLRARRIVVDDMDLSDIKTHHGDFDQGELSRVLNDERNLHGVVAPLLEQAGSRRTLVFGVDVAHAHALAEVINRHRPATALAIDGSAKPEERAAALSLFRAGAFQFLVNCALFTEGFDEPSISCVALARPTQSRALYTQMLGRGTRLHPGKPDCLVLDFVGNSGRHRLIGPADALAGRELDASTRENVEKQLDGQTELEQIVADAEKQANDWRSKAKLLALAHYRSHEVDLFVGDFLVQWDPSSKAANEPATPEQLAAIEDAKLGKPPAGMSRAEAQAILDGVKARRKAGLCTIPQARLLQRMNVDAAEMTFARAHQLIGMVAAKDAWKTPYVVLRGEPEYGRQRRRA